MQSLINKKKKVSAKKHCRKSGKKFLADFDKIEMKKFVKYNYWILAFAIASVILHNVISALLKTEEPVFFMLTFVFLAAFIVSLVYNIIYLQAKRKK